MVCPNNCPTIFTRDRVLGNHTLTGLDISLVEVRNGTYEMYLENARYIVTADSDTAILSGRLGNLADLKAQGADTLVFRTKSRETALDIDAMLSLGVEDTLFALTHSGSSATLTVGGVEHNELL